MLTSRTATKSLHSHMSPNRLARYAISVVGFACVTLSLTFLAKPAFADNENLALGNPSGATQTDPENRLVQHIGYALSYKKSDGGARWVSWHLDRGDRGRFGRSDDFRPDEALPPDSRIRATDYRNSGYDRGHMCPSADRTVTRAANSETFLMSNMLPQTAELNQHVWRDFEDYCRSLLRSGANELYIISGGLGSAERIANDKVNVPKSCWKVVVVLPTGSNDVGRINQNTRVISVLMPNKAERRVRDANWRQFLTNVDKIEELSGFDLLSNVPVDIQSAIESRIDTGRARTRRGR